MEPYSLKYFEEVLKRINPKFAEQETYGLNVCDMPVKEKVYACPIKGSNDKYFIIVFSSIVYDRYSQSFRSRGKGWDAIRVSTYDKEKNDYLRKIKKPRRVNRGNNWERRLKERIMHTADSVKKAYSLC